MDRERDERVNRQLAELYALLTEKPELAGRTRKMLAGELQTLTAACLERISRGRVVG